MKIQILFFISDMDISLFWVTLALGTVVDVSWKVQIVAIESYMPSRKGYTELCKAIPILKQKICIFCYDLTLQNETGKRFKILLSPVYSSIQQGKLKIGSCILVKKVTKIEVYGQFLVISDWSLSEDFICAPMSGWMNLDRYQDNNRLLSSDDNNRLSPWTLQFFLWKKRDSSHLDKTVPTYTEIKNQNLQQLDMNWSKLSIRWPLMVRVLSKSKARLILQPRDTRRPWISLCNFLVADCSAYSVITVWDEAVKELYPNISEGDVLFLNKSYRVGRYAPKNRKYTLQPKRRIGLSPTEIEIRINESDLNNIHILKSSSASTIPPPTWRFVSSTELSANSLADETVCDIIGCIVYYGRWERERCYDEYHKETGQFWVRLWLILVDHISDNHIKIKIYVDSSSWEKLGKCQNTKCLKSAFT